MTGPRLVPWNTPFANVLAGLISNSNNNSLFLIPDYELKIFRAMQLRSASLAQFKRMACSPTAFFKNSNCILEII